ncbi:chemotaxis protein CheC [Microcoleus sp. bin38.metabat.b11b12b14.051]|uniref:chemotaxis protein CheC n=1 Tax=Microcoleus sp. bin38.metabat.b11b12b14.051 TaxID=2742709 RepID=UPI0025EB365F|nr:chemotaxis protein CheC [Microcoleus sp. bin38.metabat.b11b12b14.051]
MELTADEIDALKELINIGVGSAAGMLNEMIQFPIRLQIPDIELLSAKELRSELKKRFGIDPLSTVQLGFTGSFSGSAQLLFPTDSAVNLVSVLTGEQKGSPDLDALKISTLSEVGNMVINGVMGSIGNILDQPLDYAVPYYAEEEIEELLLKEHSLECGSVLLAPAHFSIEELQIQGDILLFFDMGSFQMLLKAIAAVS